MRRDIFQLHLPYLTTVILLHLGQSSQPLPEAYAAAVMGASLVARICEEYLALSSLRFLNGFNGWYSTVALLALLYARKIERLREVSDQNIAILWAMLEEIARHWHSSRMFIRGLKRMFGDVPPTPGSDLRTGGGDIVAGSNDDVVPAMAASTPGDNLSYLDYFPTATTEAVPILNVLANNSPWLSSEIPWPDDFDLQLNDLFCQQDFSACDPGSSFPML